MRNNFKERSYKIVQNVMLNKYTAFFEMSFTAHMRGFTAQLSKVLQTLITSVIASDHRESAAIQKRKKLDGHVVLCTPRHDG